MENGPARVLLSRQCFRPCRFSAADSGVRYDRAIPVGHCRRYDQAAKPGNVQLMLRPKFTGIKENSNENTDRSTSHVNIAGKITCCQPCRKGNQVRNAFYL